MNLRKPFLYSFAIVLGLFCAAGALADWSGPCGASPTECNASAPLNVSGAGQTKVGGLRLNSGGAPNGLEVISGTSTFAGKVGIGTANPDKILTVAGSVANHGDGMAVFRNTGVKNAAALQLDSIGGGNANLGFSVNSVAKGGIGYDVSRGFLGFLNNAYTASDFSLRIGSDGSLTYNDAITGTAVERFRINANGNVGIGVAGPATPLEVGGSIQVHDAGLAPDNGYNGALRITRANRFSGQYINLVRSGVSGWSIGTAYDSSTFGIGPIAASDSTFSPILTITGSTVAVNGSAVCTANGANCPAGSAPAWSSITGKPFNWSGQSGQPSWLWGSNDGANYYVWNPSNFNVNYAASAGTANAVSFNGGLTTASSPSFSGLSVGNAASTLITLHDDESPNGVKYIHANTNYIGFLSGAAGWITRWDNSGNMINNGSISSGGSISAPDVCTTGGKCLSTAITGARGFGGGFGMDESLGQCVVGNTYTGQCVCPTWAPNASTIMNTPNYVNHWMRTYVCGS